MQMRWNFQLYVFMDRKITLRLVRQVEKVGYKAIVLTLDAPVVVSHATTSVSPCI
ncbi:hypothetical protein DVH05_028130 [Phytophthora capsici]|nr:hypothetical protein DVH05_028130 [Phytophthora capsici]